MYADTADEHVKNVYAHFGLAMYKAQVLEHGLVNALVVVDLFASRVGKPMPRKQWETEFDSFMGKHFKTTLARMVQSLKAATSVPWDLEVLLSAALKERNFLAHSFFRDRATEFMTSGGRENMIAVLQEAQALFETADAKLWEVIRPIRERYGFTDERLEKYFEEYRSSINSDL